MVVRLATRVGCPWLSRAYVVIKVIRLFYVIVVVII